jgi:AcrR family transcriptional regulator
MDKPSAAVAASSKAHSLDTSQPLRPRGRNTFDIILATAGNLLSEIGFERLTTNLVCERAGLTPPALYRYFPNKYALLAELARRLMEAQDEVLFRWQATGGLASQSLSEAVEQSIALRTELVSVTRAFPGGLWILRAIRALPQLQEVRVASRTKVLEQQFEFLKASYPTVSDERLRMAARLSEQAAYAMIEMLIEDPGLDERRIIEESAWMTALYFQHLVERDQVAASVSSAPPRSPKRQRKAPEPNG